MIIFASMNGCGYCDNAKKSLENEIHNNLVKVVSPQEGKDKYGMDGNGYPQFLSLQTNKKTMGFSSKENLMKDLDLVSHMEGGKGGHPNKEMFEAVYGGSPPSGMKRDKGGPPSGMKRGKGGPPSGMKDHEWVGVI